MKKIIKGQTYAKTMYVKIFGPPGTKVKNFTIKTKQGTGYMNVEDQLLKIANDLEQKWPNMEFSLKVLKGGDKFNFIFDKWKTVEDGVNVVQNEPSLTENRENLPTTRSIEIYGDHSNTST